MARLRRATESVIELDRRHIAAALEVAAACSCDAEFYALVQMRNPSRSYFVNYNGHDYSLKAVVAHALQQQKSDTLARDFHAADAAKHLAKLGYDVRHLGRERSSPAKQRR
jgi:hypothetical protein